MYILEAIEREIIEEREILSYTVELPSLEADCK